MSDDNAENQEQHENQGISFVVDEQPRMFWDWELQEKNLKFLRGIDGKYFEYLVHKHVEHLEDEDENKHYAALSIRMAYFQALETLFALLCSLIQAPNCPLGWMLSYWDLRSLVTKVNSRQRLYSRLAKNPITWRELSEIVHKGIPFDDEKNAWITQGFGDCWANFAADFVQNDLSREYNSIKHGLRTKLGGFTLAIGMETTPGVPAPKENMEVWGKSTFGSSFYVSEKIGEHKLHYRPRFHGQNWDTDKLSSAVFVAAMSITNVASYLRILNGDPPEDCEFRTPDGKEIFDEILSFKGKFKINITGMTFDTTLEPDQIDPWPKEKILGTYNITPAADSSSEESDS